MGVERVDYYSDEEYQQALYEEEQYWLNAMEEDYVTEMAGLENELRQEFLNDKKSIIDIIKENSSLINYLANEALILHEDKIYNEVIDSEIPF